MCACVWELLFCRIWCIKQKQERNPKASTLAQFTRRMQNGTKCPLICHITEIIFSMHTTVWMRLFFNVPFVCRWCFRVLFFCVRPSTAANSGIVLHRQAPDFQHFAMLRSFISWSSFNIECFFLFAEAGFYMRYVVSSCGFSILVYSFVQSVID